MSEELLRELEGFGFVTHVEPGALPELEEKIRTKGWDGIFYDESRLYRADAEDLAEGGVESFLREVEGYLARQGVRLASVASAFGPDAYSVEVNGRTQVIWQEEDERREKRDIGWTWGVAATRTVDLLNTLLSEAGSIERAYAVAGGNDLSVFFLTEPLYHLIARHPDATSEAPHTVKEEYPWFGQRPG